MEPRLLEKKCVFTPAKTHEKIFFDKTYELNENHSKSQFIENPYAQTQYSPILFNESITTD